MANHYFINKSPHQKRNNVILTWCVSLRLMASRADLLFPALPEISWPRRFPVPIQNSWAKFD